MRRPRSTRAIALETLLQVLELDAGGRSRSAIARLLGIDVSTVRYYLARAGRMPVKPCRQKEQRAA